MSDYAAPAADEGKRRLMLLSLHGLIRGQALELGRDADTGGQVTYVIELARALAQHAAVESVDVVTRRIQDPKVDDSYGEPVEPLGAKARIIRIPFGPQRYIHKEALWPYLDDCVDNLLRYVRDQGRVPDLIHGHYADAGYVAARVAAVLDTPMAFTGHSLGRVKRQRLLDSGQAPEHIERRYRLARRIEAEETALDNAAFVVTSTHQEAQEQYALYDNFRSRRMLVIPPGVDLSRFAPPTRSRRPPSKIENDARRFLHDPRKPIVLAISRPDPRKNIPALLHAFGRDRRLREVANLVLIAGVRDDVRKADKGAQSVFAESIALIDHYDLYGSVAYPKRHAPADVPELYRWAARTKGVFVNCALTEPFGLTLLEAAASGLPVVATDDGGPRDILAACQNGALVNPLDHDAIGAALLRAVTDRQQWRLWSSRGRRSARRHFTWSAHVQKYLRAAQIGITRRERNVAPFSVRKRLVSPDRLVVADIDNTLIGCQDGLRALLERLRSFEGRVAFGVATGRNLALTLEALRTAHIDTPTVLFTSVGTAIHYGPHLVEDLGWQQHIRFRWRPDAAREALADLPGMALQGPEGQSALKIGYRADGERRPTTEEIRRRLRKRGVQAHVVRSYGVFVDILPVRASKGAALRHFTLKWDIPPERCLVAGNAGGDEDMLRGAALGVVVANHTKELDALRGAPRVYFAERAHAWGVLDALEHYHFLDPLGALEQPAHA